jgi:creatinine amidohydrolase
MVNKFSEVSWKDLEKESLDIVMVPVGSTEQHGPHLPLATDSTIAENIAYRASEDTDVLVTPTIEIGVSEEHKSFCGTIYVKPETFRSYVRDVLVSLSEQGVDKVVLVNGHGGNINHLQEVSQELTRKGVIFSTEWTWWRSVDSSDMGHAGPLETSLISYLEPEKVKKDEKEEGASSWGLKFEGAKLAYDVDEFSENGVVGDPKEASEKRGEKIFESASKGLVNLLRKLKTKESKS